MDLSDSITTTEAARLLGCDAATVHDYLKRGRLPILAKLGPRATVLRRADVLRLRAERLEAVRARLAALEALEART